MNVSSVGGYSYSYDTQYASSSSARASMGDPLTELDTDGDGALSLEESGLDEDQFSVMDADGDGYLTETDRESMPPPPGMGDIGGMTTAELIASLDTDEDGVLTQEESGFTDELFASLDTDENGTLSEAEMEAGKPDEAMEGMGTQAMGPPPEAASIDLSGLMSSLDSDDDGSVSQEESGLDDEEYDELDTNEDGVVSQAELEAANFSTIASMLDASGLGTAGGLGSGYGMASYAGQGTTGMTSA